MRLIPYRRLKWIVSILVMMLCMACTSDETKTPQNHTLTKTSLTQQEVIKDVQDQPATKNDASVQNNSNDSLDPVVIDLSAKTSPEPEKTKQIAQLKSKPKIKKKQQEHATQSLNQLSRQDIATVLRKHQASFQQCALSYFEKNPSEQEINLQLELTIASTGKITVFRMLPDHHETSSLGLCFQQKSRQIRFPRHRDKSVSISFPLKFQAVKE